MFIFLIGAAIGAVLTYYYMCNFSETSRMTGSRSLPADADLQDLRSELARCKQENIRLKGLEEASQANADADKSLGVLQDREPLSPAPETESSTAVEADETADDAETKDAADFIERVEAAEEPVSESQPEEELSALNAGESAGARDELEEASQADADADKSLGVLQDREPLSPAPGAESSAAAEADETAEDAETKDADDLRRVEGIGPKVAQHLNNAGIRSFAQLADTDVQRLQEILTEAGGIYKSMDPQSWPEQAALAAKGDWETLKILQDKLDGGRYTS